MATHNGPTTVLGLLEPMDDTTTCKPGKKNSSHSCSVSSDSDSTSISPQGTIRELIMNQPWDVNWLFDTEDKASKARHPRPRQESFHTTCLNPVPPLRLFDMEFKGEQWQTLKWLANEQHRIDWHSGIAPESEKDKSGKNEAPEGEVKKTWKKTKRGCRAGRREQEKRRRRKAREEAWKARKEAQKLASAAKETKKGQPQKSVPKKTGFSKSKSGPRKNRVGGNSQSVHLSVLTKDVAEQSAEAPKRTEKDVRENRKADPKRKWKSRQKKPAQKSNPSPLAARTYAEAVKKPVATKTGSKTSAQRKKALVKRPAKKRWQSLKPSEKQTCTQWKLVPVSPKRSSKQWSKARSKQASQKAQRQGKRRRICTKSVACQTTPTLTEDKSSGMQLPSCDSLSAKLLLVAASLAVIGATGMHYLA